MQLIIVFANPGQHGSLLYLGNCSTLRGRHLRYRVRLQTTTLCYSNNFINTLSMRADRQGFVLKKFEYLSPPPNVYTHTYNKISVVFSQNLNIPGKHTGQGFLGPIYAIQYSSHSVSNTYTLTTIVHLQCNTL